eukprot:m.255201 g.255201  ORF g.255201 m.255201 type:complete len:195 (+) comp40393_c0_seq14:1214-1798(+)
MMILPAHSLPSSQDFDILLLTDVEPASVSRATVIIGYSDGRRLTQDLPSHLFSVGDAVARYGDGSTLIQAVMKHPYLNVKIREAVAHAIAEECRELAKKSPPISLLRPSDLQSFSVRKAQLEFSDVAPMLMSILVTAASSQREIRRKRDVSKRGKEIGVTYAASVLMKCRDKDMSAFHHVVGLYLHHQACSKQA